MDDTLGFVTYLLCTGTLRRDLVDETRRILVAAYYRDSHSGVQEDGTLVAWGHEHGVASVTPNQARGDETYTHQVIGSIVATDLPELIVQPVGTTDKYVRGINNNNNFVISVSVCTRV